MSLVWGDPPVNRDVPEGQDAPRWLSIIFAVGFLCGAALFTLACVGLMNWAIDTWVAVTR